MMLKKRWTIRKAVISDAQSLRECMQAAYEIYTPRLGGETLPPMISDGYNGCQNNVPICRGGVPLYFSNGYINPSMALCPPD